MSILEDLRARTLELSQDTQRTAQNLSAYARTFAKQRDGINRALRGSNQRKDQELMATIHDADRQVKEAVAALEQASRVARDYAHSI